MMTISLSPQTEKLLEQRLRTGAFASADKVVHAALLLLEEHEKERQSAFESLKEKLERATAQAERGELVDGEEAFARSTSRIAGHNRAVAS